MYVNLLYHRSHLRDVCDRFQNMLNSQLRLANQGRRRFSFLWLVSWTLFFVPYYWSTFNI